MKSIKKVLQALSLKQLLVAFFIGVMVLTSTACSNADVATTTTKPLETNPSIEGNPSTVGQDMYPYEDTRMDTSAADAKTTRAIQKNERLRNKNESVGEAVQEALPNKSVGEQAKDVGRSTEQAVETAGDKTQQAAENTAKNTRRGLKNLKENTENAIEQAGDALDQAT
jgi:hypothetical protein